MDFLRPWLPSLGVFAAAVLGGFVFEFVLLKRLQRWAERTESPLDDVLVQAIAKPLAFWILLGGLAAAAEAAPLIAAHTAAIQKAAVALFLLSLTLSASTLASLALREYAKFHGSARTAGVVDNLVRGVVLVLGGLLVLSNLGISITPLLGALGVGSLAVALALQDTLTNLFAGLHIVASKIVEVGDYVKLDSGQEGTVTDIGWRVTRIEEGAGNDVILPNSKLANAVIVNYQRPSPGSAVVIPLSVAYGSDLDKVEQVTIDVGSDIQRRIPGATRGFEPVVRYTAFGPSEIRFNAILRSDTFKDRFLLTHEFLKALSKRYAADGIEAPLPTQVVHLKQAADSR